jgi:hypothetical protein
MGGQADNQPSQRQPGNSRHMTEKAAAPLNKRPWLSRT